MFKDPLVRRFISASLFAAAFVWVAVTFFHVETEVIWVLLQLSVGFVILLIVVGLLLTPIVWLLNRRRSFLSDLSGEANQQEDEPAKDRES